MFIAWQKLPVKGRGGGPFLVGDSDYAPPWLGLRCEHHGGGRTEWTPFVAQAERQAGQFRQKLIYSLPPIRSCCIEDDFHRAAWWHDVEWASKLWEELGDGLIRDEMSRGKAVILSELREVVRKPSPAGLRDFTTFRSEREVEDEARDKANRAYWNERVRRNQEQAQVDQKQRPPGYFAVLGLRLNATLDQVKARHREQVKRHHPDRGGDPAKFREIQEAYEQAVADLERRANR